MSNKKLNILISMNSFKGCLSALEANKIVNNAVKGFSSNCSLVPLVDGGTGSLEAWNSMFNFTKHPVKTVDSYGNYINANILVHEKTAFIEMALASGIHLVDTSFDIMNRTTYGTGLLVKEALNLGCDEVYIGLGGSATHDLGTGILRALGVAFKDINGNELTTPNELINTSYIDDTNLDKRAVNANITLLCDVNNPLLGEIGAAHVFAPQKGANTHKALSLCEKFSRHLYNMHDNFEQVSGDGAAGGIPYLLRYYLNAKILSGSDFVIDYFEILKKIKEYDLVITGEGQFDEQSFFGKGPGRIIEIASINKIPVIVLTGGYKAIVSDYNNVSIFSINNYPCSLKEAMSKVGLFLENTSQNAVKLFTNGYNKCR